MRRLVPLRFRGWCLLAAFLAGCAGDYQPAAVAFHKAAQETTAAISERNELVMRLGAELRREMSIEQPARIAIAPDHCTAASLQGCKLEFRKTRDAAPELLRAGTEPYRNTMALARAIETYAAGLQAIAEADTAGAARAAAAEAVGAVHSLAATTASIKGTGAAVPDASLAQPVGAAAGWVLGEYANAQKVADLRAVTALAEGTDGGQRPLPEAAALFAEALALGDRALLPTMADRVLAAEQAFKLNPSASTYDAYVGAAEAMDVLVHAEASDIPRQLQRAHTALYEALQGDRIENLDDFFAAVGQIQAKAAELKEIIAALRAALAQPEEPSS